MSDVDSMLGPGSISGTRETLIEAAHLVPKGVLCLLSALRFYGLTTQSPYEIWMAIPPGTWRPQPTHLKLRVFRFSGRALTHGVQEHPEHGVKLRVDSPAKTVVDCFKFRNKVGLDVALEALRDGLRKRLFAMDELWEAARIV